MLQIFLYGNNEEGFLDLSPGASLDIEATIDLFDEELNSGEFSLPVEIPWTENNRRLMSFAERVENFNSNITYWVCDVYDRGFPEMINAKLTLLEKTGTFNYKKGTFNASISGTKGLFGSVIKNQKLRDLTLGGVIDWTSMDIDSIHFSEKLMKGEFPQWDYIGFAPVAIENFFDKNKNYTDEFLAKDTVNYIISTGGGPDDWIFGRPKSTDETTAAPAGDREYIDFRTVPFFKLRYVLEKVFSENGYNLTGELLNNQGFNDLYIYNNQSINFFSYSVFQDYNRRIVPRDHMPDITVTEFLKNVFSFFNVYPVFNAYNVELRYRVNAFKKRVILDITDRVEQTFSSTYKDAGEESGYTIDYAWDSNDDINNDRIKDLTGKNICASVSTIPNLGTLDIGRPFTTDDLVYVESENMYYAVANATVTPILWDAWSEKLGPLKVGDGSRSVNIGMGTLCTYVEYSDADALFIRRNRVAARQTGSYRNNTYHDIKSPFSLRVFFITKQLIDGNNIPVSFNHNANFAGTILEPFSLAIDGPFGLSAVFHEAWQNFQEGKETIKVTVNADKKFMLELNNSTMVQIKNTIFLVQKIESNIPLEGVITLYIQPL